MVSQNCEQLYDELKKRYRPDSAYTSESFSCHSVLLPPPPHMWNESCNCVYSRKNPNTVASLGTIALNKKQFMLHIKCIQIGLLMTGEGQVYDSGECSVFPTDQLSTQPLDITQFYQSDQWMHLLTRHVLLHFPAVVMGPRLVILVLLLCRFQMPPACRAWHCLCLTARSSSRGENILQAG
ncbi:hypothetical protein CBL_03312 [Carabus blaptoides fortunei]